MVMTTIKRREVMVPQDHSHHFLIMEDDDDEDLFEIDLDLVNCISSSSPSKPHYYNTATTSSTTNSNYSTGKKNALLANCLMPISDISSAIPACNKSKNISSNNYNVVISESFSLEEYLRLPFLGDIGALLHGKTKPQFQFKFHH
ncbi:uncharacterized protein LOC130957632 [Arachis stenosperma]|uniref:uncharacterized protein LOC130957632 n=1 Tax=Arachis stenosperma TaxID=217475 RepID=UPI0025ABA609|nr:uncharacterized protein LOC130957632 [Arachis stenosperma]